MSAPRCSVRSWGRYVSESQSFASPAEREAEERRGVERWSLPEQRLLHSEGEAVRSAACGEHHVLLVTVDGELYAAGRGQDGALGLGGTGAVGAGQEEAQLVEALGDEIVVDCACGSNHSMALTASGGVFMWGLVHVDDEGNDAGGGSGGKEGATDNAQSAARRGDARSMLGRGHDHHNRVLRRIVSESEARWLNGAENDLSDGGISSSSSSGGDDPAAATSAATVAAADGQESGVVRMDSRRRKVATPRLVRSLAGVRVASLAAGFGHSLALSADGRVFSCGYNDRGQLGLGHRINSPTFALINPKHFRLGRVVQICCGGQHNLARVLMPAAVASAYDDGDAVGVFVWGNGALGQLGLGQLGATTASRVPVPLTPAPWQQRGEHGSEYGSAGDRGGANDGSSVRALQPIFVAAGANHSLCICKELGDDDGDGVGESEETVGGSVIFSWGHGEYGQHGTVRNVSSSDLNRASDSPRSVPLGHLGGGLSFVRAACGSCFSAAVTADGDVVSWGWVRRSHTVHTCTLLSVPLPQTPEIIDLSSNQPPTTLDARRSTLARFIPFLLSLHDPP